MGDYALLPKNYRKGVRAKLEILSLTDNLCALPGCKAQHGLCLYIKTENHKILFDLGQDGTFIRNAHKLGVDIADIDTVIISHGHYDHGGGLAAFLKHNRKAKIYIRKSAFDKHYAVLGKINIPIGLHDNNMNNPRIVFTPERFSVDDELELFSGVSGQKFMSNANDGLLAKHNGEYITDAFEHEQYLIVTESSTRLLITGCSHKGIVNIMEQYQKIHGNDSIPLLSVIGGFHLYNPTKKEYASEDCISRLAENLDCFNIHYYTCHCTGELAYLEMKKLLKDKLDYLATGGCVQITDNGSYLKNPKEFS